MQSEERTALPRENGVNDPADPGGGATRPRRGSRWLALSLLVVVAVVVAANMLRSRPVAVVTEDTRHCKLCGRTTRVDTDTIRTVAKLSAVARAADDIGLRSYGPSKNLLSSSYLHHDLLKALQRGDRRYSVETYEETCDSCLDALVPMQVGYVRKCEFCAERLGQAVSTRYIKRRLFTDDSMTTKTGFCGSRACRLKRDHPMWELSLCQTIAAGEIQIGFTAEQAIAAWGRPDDINRTVTSYGTHEQWVYDRGDYSAQYLYFEDGTLTSWQD